jgi:hypothetical protein
MPRPGLGVSVFALLVIATACGGPQAAPGSTPGTTIVSFDPRNFLDSAKITNRWFPLVPGTRFVFHGQVRGVHQVVEGVVTDEVKLIDGVKARDVADQDIDEGQLVGETRDYYAQDKHGNVWYMGELSTHYVNGVFTDHADTWFGGARHAKPGVIMLAHPRLKLPAYQQEFAPSIATDKGRVIRFHQSVCVPLGCFRDTMEIEETSPLDPGVVEHKYFVLGIGLVRSDIVQGDPGESNLVSTTPPS